MAGRAPGLRPPAAEVRTRSAAHRRAPVVLASGARAARSPGAAESAGDAPAVHRLCGALRGPGGTSSGPLLGSEGGATARRAYRGPSQGAASAARLRCRPSPRSGRVRWRRSGREGPDEERRVRVLSGGARAGVAHRPPDASGRPPRGASTPSRPGVQRGPKVPVRGDCRLSGPEGAPCAEVGAARPPRGCRRRPDRPRAPRAPVPTPSHRGRGALVDEAGRRPRAAHPRDGTTVALGAADVRRPWHRGGRPPRRRGRRGRRPGWRMGSSVADAGGGPRRHGRRHEAAPGRRSLCLGRPWRTSTTGAPDAAEPPPGGEGALLLCCVPVSAGHRQPGQGFDVSSRRSACWPVGCSMASCPPWC